MTPAKIDAAPYPSLYANLVWHLLVMHLAGPLSVHQPSTTPTAGGGVELLF